ncbi:MAG: TIGR03915 family putative DNA repair protein [Lachnospiraceae bacterium]|nr:TIGR03915 family putative DNA repair protein [Lachnospiraceae bacterium]
MLVFQCEDQAESILTGVYDAWADPVPNREIRLVLSDDGQQELFCEYRKVKTDDKKAQKVAESIVRKLGKWIWSDVEFVLLADAADKAQAVFSYLRLAFSIGPEIRQQLARPEVMRICELVRMVSREQQHLFGFVRFADTPEGILIAQLEPRHRQIPLLAGHFAERLNTERFILYDKRRREAAVHSPEHGWYLTMGEADGIEEMIRCSERDGYAELWQVFFDSIAIAQRTNPRCQQNLLPMRFRPHMTEFRRDKSGIG